MISAHDTLPSSGSPATLCLEGDGDVSAFSGTLGRAKK
jgi:hypothetical protein